MYPSGATVNCVLGLFTFKVTVTFFGTGTNIDSIVVDANVVDDDENIDVNWGFGIAVGDCNVDDDAGVAILNDDGNDIDDDDDTDESEDDAKKILLYPFTRDAVAILAFSAFVRDSARMFLLWKYA